MQPREGTVLTVPSVSEPESLGQGEEGEGYVQVPKVLPSASPLPTALVRVTQLFLRAQ